MTMHWFPLPPLFHRLRIQGKAVIVVLVSSSWALLIAGIGYLSLESNLALLDRMRTADGAALITAGLRQRMTDLNRMEFSMAANPLVVDHAAVALLDGVEAAAHTVEGLQKSDAPIDRQVFADLAGKLHGLDYHFRIEIGAAQVAAYDPLKRDELMDLVLDGQVLFKDILSVANALADDMQTRALAIREEAIAAGQTAVTRLFLSAVTAIAVGIALATATSRYGIVLPLRQSLWALTRLSQGDTELTIPGEDRHDELGELSAAMREFRDKLRDRQRLQALEAERTRELLATLDKLQRTQDELVRTEKLAALGRMVAGIAHEVNTPLGNGLTVATTLSEKVGEFRVILDGKELRRSVLRDYSEMFETAQRLLVTNLTRAAELISSFKRVAVDQTSEVRRVYDLRVVCNEVTTMLWPTYKKSGNRIDVEIPEGIAMTGYPGALGQVLTNLVDNAMMHAFPNDRSGTVRIEAGRDSGDCIWMTVADDGKGISENDLPRIFDPFFTTRLGDGGSGLGLHIVYALVTRVLAGHIEVASAPGRGTCFSLRLPLAAPETSSAPIETLAA